MEDEFHFDEGALATGYILQEEGTRTHSEKIQERGSKKGNSLHVAGWANWWKKCDKSIFYNDEQDEVIKPKRPRKPRKSKYGSQESYEDKIKYWEASLPDEKEVQPKGNAMTQEYYFEKRSRRTYELLHSAMKSDIFNKDRPRQKEEQEHEDYDDDNEDGTQPQQEAKYVAAAMMTGKISDTHLSSRKDESAWLAGLPRSISRAKSGQVVEP